MHHVSEKESIITTQEIHRHLWKVLSVWKRNSKENILVSSFLTRKEIIFPLTFLLSFFVEIFQEFVYKSCKVAQNVVGKSIIYQHITEYSSCKKNQYLISCASMTFLQNPLLWVWILSESYPCLVYVYFMFLTFKN